MWKNLNKGESKYNFMKKKKNQVAGLFLALYISIGVIAFWRGMWQLLDLYMFPNNELLSNLLSLIIGLGILTASGYATRELM